MKRIIYLGIALCLAACNPSAQKQNTAETEAGADVISVSTTRIWEEGYSAFPSIVSWRGRFYVSFREGYSHIFNKEGIADGKARIICSEDGKNWQPVALLTKEGYDLRDPKLSVTPDDRLMVTMGGSLYVDKELLGQYPQVSFSEDGKTFSEPQQAYVAGDRDDTREWIWRVTWHEGIGYAVTYGNHFALLKTTDGINFDIVREFSEIDDFPNEATVRFSPEGKMYILIRRDGKDNTAYWGSSDSPYTDWEFKKLPMHVGGPEVMLLDNGKVIIGGRCHFPGMAKTMIWKGKTDGSFNPYLILPSGWDNSYPGFLRVGDELWTVYYSSHELKRADDGYSRAGIYLAKMPMSMFE